MNTGTFDVRASYQGGNYLAPVDNLARKLVRDHYLVAFAVLVVLVIVVLWMVYKSKERFMPTRTSMYADSDQVGLMRKVSDVPWTDSSFSKLQDGQSLGRLPTTSAAVLASPEFACKAAKKPSGEAWDWMTQQGSGTGVENMANTDSKFSKILMGHN